MKVTVDARAPNAAQVDLLAVPIASDEVRRSRLAPRLAAIDRSIGGAIAAAVQSGDFTGKAGQQVLAYPDRRRKAKRVLLSGLGDAKAIDAEALRAASGTAVSRAAGAHSTRVALVVPPLGAGTDPESCQALAEGAVLGGYRFDAYREKSEETASRVSSVALLVPRDQNLRASRDAARRGIIIADSQNAARELSNLPPNVLSPEQLAQEARTVARETGLAPAAARGARVRAERRREEITPVLHRGQGHHVRFRRHLDQTRAGHGRDEARHVGRGDRDRRAARGRAARAADPRGGRDRRRREPAWR